MVNARQGSRNINLHIANFADARKLLLPLMDNELHRLSAWMDPLGARTIPNLENSSPQDRAVHFLRDVNVLVEIAFVSQNSMGNQS